MGYVVCGACAFPIPPQNWNAGGAVPCPVCARNVEVLMFAAAARPHVDDAPEPVVTAEEASCYYHAGSRAAVPCDACGRFLCGLCDIPFEAGHYCPQCFEQGKDEALERATISERVNFDSIGLALVTLPMLLCWLPLITTPVALFFAIRSWNQPSLVIERSRWRQWLTLGIAAVQLIAVAGLIFYIRRLP